MASKTTKAAAGLPRLKTSAANPSHSSNSASPSAQSPVAPLSASTPTSLASAWSPHSSAPTPTLLSTSPASSTHPHQHQPQIQPPPTQPLRAAIQPAPARKSLPRASGTALATPAAPVNRMSMASVISPMPGPPPAQAPISMTTKEWVIPPRPKPGRKPATDTPPTKRKAQNRAAQRAFRERRAARVGELEEQLELDQQEHDKLQQALQEQIRRLEMDAQALQSRCEVLENMLDKERAERAREVEGLRNRLHQATQQHHRPQSLPSIASVPQHSHTYAPQPLRHHRPSAPSRLHAGRASTSSLNSSRVSPSTTHRPTTTHSFSISQIISPPEDIEQAPTGCGNCEPTGPCACADEAIASVNVGCGNCTLGSRCQCLEEVLNGGHHESHSRSNSTNGSRQATSRMAKRSIRSMSPSSTAPEEKRQRGSLATETDFTAMFSRKSQRPTPSLPTPAAMNNAATPQSNAPTPYSMATLAPMESQAAESPRPEAEDRCGFCEDGTYCACAEAAAFNAATTQAPSESLTLPAINSSAFSSASRANGQTRTPPPSEGDAIGYEILPDGSVKLPSLRGLQSRNKPSNMTNTTLPKPSGGCGPDGPGTCAQCLSDPVSGLFCRSLAANFKKNGDSSGGCCGGGGPGGCCKDKSSNNDNNNNTEKSSSSHLGLSLSCADAYKTLASHKHFTEAADDINTWLPRLKAAPKPREPQLGKDGSGRPPIEVEAASIMGVLKGFDVRFGRGE